MTVLNLDLLSLQCSYLTLLQRPLEPLSHSLYYHIYMSILILFTMCHFVLCEKPVDYILSLYDLGKNWKKVSCLNAFQPL